MTTPLLCLLVYALWTLGIAFVGVALVRTAEVLAGRAKANAFPGDQPHGSERYRRTMRAHANCVENLPVFAAVVLVAAVLEIDLPALDALAVVTLVARFAQTAIHIASGSAAAVTARATVYGVQVVAIVAMAVLIMRHAA